jgi:hypothetical protein
MALALQNDADLESAQGGAVRLWELGNLSDDIVTVRQLGIDPLEQLGPSP